MVVVCTIDICSFMLTYVSLDFHSKPVGPVVSSRSILYSPLPSYSRNLYEEGKVCLSILGTWAGDRTESWNPARSSLLQAFVSIQGLVLVKEPCVLVSRAYDTFVHSCFADGIVSLHTKSYEEQRKGRLIG